MFGDMNGGAMALDQDRIRAIYENKHTYYGSRRAAVRQDYRLHPFGSGDYVAAQVSPSMDVLDLGCGDGDKLLKEVCDDFGCGPRHETPMVGQIRKALEEQGISIRLAADLFSK